MFPSEYRQLFVVEHGSWNSTKKVGYQIEVFKVKNNKIVSGKPFITGGCKTIRLGAGQ